MNQNKGHSSWYEMGIISSLFVKTTKGMVAELKSQWFHQMLKFTQIIYISNRNAL
jgi:hypothetical protein